MQQNQPNPNKDKNSGLQSYARYSGLAFQMIAIILAFVWVGRKIDEKFLGGKSVFIIVMSLTGVLVAMYILLKDFIKPGKKK